MLRLLLWKDLRRARRNPLPWLINLCVPIVIVAIVGLIFGRKGDDGSTGLGRIRFALVDEDRSQLIELLRGGLNQGTAAKFLDPVFLEREPALAQLQKDKLSAVVILPKGFTRGFLASEPVKIELIKNPAQSIYPTAMEEMLRVLTTALEALARNFAPELKVANEFLSQDPATAGRAWWDTMTDESRRRDLGEMFDQTGTKLMALRDFLDPPLVWYTTVQKPGEPKPAGAFGGGGGGFNLFGYMLLGTAGMFLLFLANIGMTDLHTEVQIRTLQRFRTVHDSLGAFVSSKVVFAGVMVTLCATLLLGGGALVFGVTWRHPLELTVLVLAFVLFTTGLMALFTALVPDQRAAEGIKTLVAMTLGMGGGCAFPPNMYPAFYRDHVLPWVPTHWFADAARAVEYNAATHAIVWSTSAAKLFVGGLLCLGLAAWLLRRNFLKGGRA